MVGEKLGRAAVSSGWRASVADKLAPRVANRTPLSADDVRILLGLAFVGVSGYYLVRTLAGAVRRR